MSETIKNLGVYRLAIFIGILFSINALSSSIIASFLNVEWSQLSHGKQFTLVFVVAQNWTGVLLAYFNKTLVRMEKGLPPGPTEGDTTTFTKQSIQPKPA
jgi:hypothetical protein